MKKTKQDHWQDILVLRKQDKVIITFSNQALLYIGRTLWRDSIVFGNGHQHN